MTKEEMEKLIQFHKTVSTAFDEIAGFAKSETFNELDNFNKDIVLTQASAMQALLGITAIRIGSNLSIVSKQEDSENAEQPKEDSNEQEPATEARPE